MMTNDDRMPRPNGKTSVVCGSSVLLGAPDPNEGPPTPTLRSILRTSRRPSEGPSSSTFSLCFLYFLHFLPSPVPFSTFYFLYFLLSPVPTLCPSLVLLSPVLLIVASSSFHCSFSIRVISRVPCQETYG